jgi:uncharacterized phage protein (TIGR01671 family)
MRDREYRAWHKGEKKMYPVEVLQFSSTSTPVAVGLPGMLPLNGEYLLDGVSVILLEYTGLKDTNGKKIFEGDIVTYLKDIGDKNEEIDYVVELDLQSLPFILFVNDGTYLCEVIGNIYENPELMTQRL